MSNRFTWINDVSNGNQMHFPPRIDYNYRGILVSREIISESLKISYKCQSSLWQIATSFIESSIRLLVWQIENPGSPAVSLEYHILLTVLHLQNALHQYQRKYVSTNKQVNL